MARGRGRTLAKKASAPKVRITVDPKRKARWEKLSSVLARARRDEAGGYDTYWEAVGEILDAELYVDGGYETADDFLRAVVKEPKRTAMRHVRVAKYASPDDEAKYGVAIVDGAIAYLEAKLGPLKDKLPFPLKSLRIPTEVDGKPRRLSLDQITAEQIRAATKALTKASGTSRAKTSPSEAVMAKAFRKVPALRDVKVHVASGFVHLGAIPLHAIDDLVKTLRALDLPADA